MFAIVIGLLLLIVPGFILILGLSQTFRVMHDNPELSSVDILKKSWGIMKGHKGDYFIFNLSFIGWVLLCICTIGIGFVFLAPYMLTANSKFYDEITGKKDDVLNSIGEHLQY